MKALLIFFLAGALAQANAQTLRADHVVDRNSGGFREFAEPPPLTATNVYLSDAWSNGALALANGASFKDLKVRYDLKNDYLEIDVPGGVRIVKAGNIASFSVQTPSSDVKQFRIAKSIQHGLSGIVEQLVQGPHSLYVRYFLQTIPANYNPALNIGSKIETYKIREELMLESDGDCVDLSRINSRNNPFSSDKKLADFIESHRLDLKKKDDLMTIVRYWNEISGN